MRHINVEKKRPARWPWLLGGMLLVLAIWGISFLLRAPEPTEPPAVGTTAADTLPPAIIPLTESDDFGAEAPDVSDLAPIQEEDIGKVVSLEGVVVATGNESLWLLSDTLVLRVDSPRRARRGDTIAISGVLQPADSAAARRMATGVMARHPDFEQWSIIQPFKLVERAAREDAASDAGATAIDAG